MEIISTRAYETVQAMKNGEDLTPYLASGQNRGASPKKTMGRKDVTPTKNASPTRANKE
jgi:hypothetical protein